MSLPSYCVQKLGAGVWAVLQLWYSAFSASPHWELLRRNLDRECDRDDIHQLIWNDFLRDVAALYSPPNPCKAIDVAIQGRRQYFLLPGRRVFCQQDALYRYMRLDHLLDYNLKLPIPPGDLAALAQEINAGRIGGRQMENTLLGKPSSPVWCTDHAPGTIADDIRNQMGLKHIDGGYLAEVVYPPSLLEEEGYSLHAPTCLDACWDGSENWIFVKNRQVPGGPGFGYTVDMTGGGAGAPGCPEAVHAPFPIQPGQGARFQLRALGPIRTSAPSLDFSQMCSNPGL